MLQDKFKKKGKRNTFLKSKIAALKNERMSKGRRWNKKWENQKNKGSEYIKPKVNN